MTEDRLHFPDGPVPGKGLPATIANVDYLLQRAGIDARYDVIKKKNVYRLPAHQGTAENLDNVAISTATSLAAKHGLPTGLVPEFVHAVADSRAFNPVADWIGSRAWDGRDRLGDVCATITVADDYPTIMRDLLVAKWMRSAAAAATVPGFRNRGVLTLQGPQGVGKTSWVRSLVDDEALRDSVVKLDHHLDASNKDSILGAISHWIVEIGELDSSFKKDIARLKGFLTNDSDRVRRPYARAESEYQRRTVFIATVNDPLFLTDHTGNSRWWTVAVDRLDFGHGIDMQQAFAQAAAEVRDGQTWWLDAAEEQMLDALNRDYRTPSAIGDAIRECLDVPRHPDSKDQPLTPTELLIRLGLGPSISNAQAKEAGAVLRELLGEPKKNKGRMTWRVPFNRPDPATWAKPKPESEDTY